MDNEKLSQELTELWDSLTDEQKEKAKACESFDELMEFAGDEGIELPVEVLDNVAGGYTFFDPASHTYEVINDETGDVMADGFYYLDNAQTNARYMRQSPDLLTWEQLDALRKSNKKSSSGC
jgi:hypothetical protein